MQAGMRPAIVGMRNLKKVSESLYEDRKCYIKQAPDTVASFVVWVATGAALTRFSSFYLDRSRLGLLHLR